MLHFFKFIFQLFKPKSDTDNLIMTILCRNEVDIIEENIRTHSELGVDGFVVMDNGSSDGTREKLSELAIEFNIHIIDQASQTYQQAKWMTQLAHYARKNLKARWVISNDADEFWIPEDGDLKSHLSARDSVITVERYNMLLTESVLESSYHFSKAQYRVKYPISYNRQVQKKDNNISMLLVPISPKVIVNPNGLIKLSGGNHRAKHIGKSLFSRAESRIKVYHYPIRSYAQFEANIKHRQKLLTLPNARMGDHYRRWVRIFEEGRLYDEFKRFILSPEDIKVFEKYGVIDKDLRPSLSISNSIKK